MPEVTFLAVGGEGEGASHPPNVNYLGFVDDMAALYPRVSALLRLTPHDGLPKMVLESLACGRNVIWSFPFPHCNHAKNVVDALDSLVSLRSSRKLNREGADFVKREFPFDRIANQLASTIRDVIE